MQDVPPQDPSDAADVSREETGGHRWSRTWLFAASALVVVASAVAGGFLLDEQGPSRRVRTERSQERGTTRATPTSGRPSATPPRSGTVVTLSSVWPPPIVGGGSIWMASADGVQRIDPATGASLAVVVDAFGGPVAFESGRVWLLGVDPDRRCDTAPDSTFPDYAPYVVSAVDPASNSVVSVTELPGTCRYAADNRNPEPQVVAGGGSVWINESASSCSAFEIAASTGAIVSTISLESGMVGASDRTGAWRISPAVPAGSCTNMGFVAPSQLDRIDDDGTVIATNVLPDAYVIASVAVDDQAAWVTYFATSLPLESQALRLVRIDVATGAVTKTGIHPGSVTVGSGQVWFLGSYPNGPSRSASGARPGILGQLDIVSGAIVKSVKVDAKQLRSDLPYDLPKLISVADGTAMILGSTPPRLINVSI